ncbi:MAG: hypothetical protein QNJ40_16080 [Xanthomonadales bacterium]|nr:hypothetical protein [Xanthomonadales bacterium]
MFVTNAAAGLANAVNPKTPLIDLIEKVKKLDDITSNAEAALQVLLGKVSSDTWEKALDLLGLDDAEIKARIQKLRGYLVQVQDGLDPILMRLSDRPDLVELPLAFDEAQALNIGSIALALEAEADLGIFVRNQMATASDVTWGPVAEGDALQIFSASGGLGLTGSAAPGAGTLSFSTSARTTAEVAYQYAASTTVIESLMASARHFTFPWDFAELAKNLQPISAEGRCLGLRRAQITGSGNFQLAGGATIGRALTYSGSSQIPALDARAQLGATISFSLARSGNFKVVMERGASGNLALSVTRTGSSTRSGAIDLGADIDVKGLDGPARKYADQFLRDPAGIIKDLEDFKTPGDRVTEFLGDIDDDLKQDLAAVLVGERQAGAAAETAADRLRNLITEQFNERLAFWSAVDESAIARNAVSRISDRLQLNATLQQKLSEQLLPKLEDAIGKVKQKVDDRIAEKIAEIRRQAGDAAQEKLAEFLDPLDDIGESVQDLVADLDELVEQVRAPVLKWLRRYEDIRLKIYRGLEKVARFRISLAFSASISTRAGTESVLSFELARDSEQALIACRALLLGRFEAGWSAFEQAREAGDIVNIDGLFKSWLNRTRSFGLSLRIADFSTSMTRTASEDINVAVTPTGEVVVAGVQLSQEAISEMLYARRSVSMFGAYDIAIAARDRDAFPSPLGFGLAYSDERMRARELRQLLQSLERPIRGRRLIREGATADALAAYEELTGDDKAANARLDLSLPICIDDLARLIHVDDVTIETTAIQFAIEALLKDSRLQTAKNAAASYQGGMPLVEFSLALRDLEIREVMIELGAPIGTGSSRFQGILRQLQKIAIDAARLVVAVQQIRVIATLQAEIAADPTGSDQGSPIEIRDVLRNQLDSAAKRINDNLASWIAPRDPVSGIFTEELPGRTVALLQLLSVLATDEQNLMPVVQVADAGGAEFAVV